MLKKRQEVETEQNRLHSVFLKEIEDYLQKVDRNGWTGSLVPRMLELKHIWEHRQENQHSSELVTLLLQANQESLQKTKETNK